MKYLLLIFLLGNVAALGQSAHKHLRMGDRLYTDGYLEAAEDQYRQASIKDGGATKGTYNLGNTLYHQERLQEAANQYERHIERTDDSTTLANAYHNLGNTYYKLKQYDKSVEAYKHALKRNPDDIDTKRNLVQAMRQLRMQQQQQQQQNQPQQNQQQDQNDKQDQPQSSASSQPIETNPDRKNSKQAREDISKEEAEQLLNIVDRKDKEVQEKLRKTSGQTQKPKKDW